jgi:hypothetical protein
MTKKGMGPGWISRPSRYDYVDGSMVFIDAADSGGGAPVDFGAVRVMSLGSSEVSGAVVVWYAPSSPGPAPTPQ